MKVEFYGYFPLKVPITSELVKTQISVVIVYGDPLLAGENHRGYIYRQTTQKQSPPLRSNNDYMEPTIPNHSHVLIREQAEVEYWEITAVLGQW